MAGCPFKGRPRGEGKMVNKLAALLLISGCLFFSSGHSTCFAQQYQAPEVCYARGELINVSFVNSSITLKALQPDGRHDEITFFVTPHTKINRGSLFLSISDLMEGDEIIVQYRELPMAFSGRKADRIDVKSI